MLYVFAGTLMVLVTIAGAQLYTLYRVREGYPVVTRALILEMVTVLLVTLVAAEAYLLFRDSGTGGGNTTIVSSALPQQTPQQTPQLPEGKMVANMNTTPIFEDGSSEGSLLIVNDEKNIYPQIVEITLDETGETIFRSGRIDVGQRLANAKLEVDLDAGVYQCTAHFIAVDAGTGMEVARTELS